MRSHEFFPRFAPSFSKLESAIDNQDADAFTSDPVFYLWSQKLVSAEIDWFQLRDKFRAMQYSFLECSVKRVRPFAFDKNIEEARLSLAKQMGKQRGAKRTFIPDDFWREIIKALYIEKTSSKQDSVIKHMNEWVLKNNLQGEISERLIKERVSDIWKDSDLAIKNRRQK